MVRIHPGVPKNMCVLTKNTKVKKISLYRKIKLYLYDNFFNGNDYSRREGLDDLFSNFIFKDFQKIPLPKAKFRLYRYMLIDAAGFYINNKHLVLS